MKEVIKRDGIVPVKELRKRSPVPFLVAGLAFLLYGLTTSIVSVWDYALGAGILAIGYAVGRAVFKDEVVRIEMKPDTGDVNANQLLLEAREALVAIRAANDRIADEKVSRNIEGIESSCLKILDRLEADTELYGQLRTFLRYYLPTTRKLLDARAAIEQGGVSSQSAAQVSERTDRILPAIRQAFEKQLEALDKHRYLDLQVEIDVMEGMLKSGGLSPERERI